MNRMLESVPDTVDKREGSIIYDALAPAAAELVKCYMELDVVMDETFVDTASLQYLMLRCKERGVAIQGETAAVIEGVFTPSTVELSAGLRFNCDEVNYVVTEKISAGHYKLEAETLGTVGNKYTGLLLPIQTVNGLDTAQIAAVLIPAEDGDTTDTLREKYYASIDGEAFGGQRGRLPREGQRDYRCWRCQGLSGLERRRYGQTDCYRIRLYRAEQRAYQQGTDRHRPRTEPR